MHTSVTDARGKVFGTTFDALGRVIAETNPQNQTLTYGYDARDGLISHQDARAVTTTRVVDGFGQVIRESSPDSGQRDFWYDEGGRLTRVDDADGRRTDFGYDASGRRTAAFFAGAPQQGIVYTYDNQAAGNHGRGRLTGLTDALGTAAYRYDAQGRVTEETRGLGGRAYVTTYAYDANGEVTQIGYPSGRVVTVGRASDGLATGITTQATAGGATQTVAGAVAYRPFGDLGSLVFGNGLQHARAYDGNGWLSWLYVGLGAPAAPVMNLDLLRDGDGRLTTVGDTVNASRNAAFGYTDAGRLMTAAGPWGSDVYGYDAGRNRTSVSRTIGSTTVAEAVLPAAGSNRLISVSSGGSTIRTFSHSPAGMLQTDVRGGVAYAYGYDARGRLSTASINGTAVGRYGYDAFGRRSWREATQGSATIRRHYLFDGDGRLLAEHDADTGAAVREYVWLDDTPLALIDRAAGGAPRTLFIHAGHLDEPLMMTDASGVIVWEAQLEPFGAATVMAGASAAMDLRLPGQELQQETGGLHQNFHRDYDPSLGRYLQPDPLGLEAGPNAYAYVDGDPLNAVDPTGLVDLNLISPLETNLHRLANERQTDIPGYFTIAAHGDPRRIVDQNGRRISMSGLANLIRRHPAYAPGMPVLLYACRTAQGPLPQQLSNQLGAPVLAPIGYGFWAPGFRPWSADRLPNGFNGRPRPWLQFTPNGRPTSHQSIPDRTPRPWYQFW